MTTHQDGQPRSAEPDRDDAVRRRSRRPAADSPSTRAHRERTARVGRERDARDDYRLVSVDLPDGRVVAGTLVQSDFLELRDPRLAVEVDDVILVDGRPARVSGFTRREHVDASDTWLGSDGIWMQLNWESV